MSASTLGATLLLKAAAPIIKDLYENAKGETRKSLTKWGTKSFPKKFSRSLSDIDTVRTIWSPEKNVSLRNFYYPCKVVSRSGEHQDISTISDLGKGCVVLQGIVGQGKSILLRYLALQEILHSTNPRIPLFLELRKLSKSTSLLEGISRSLSDYDIKVNDDSFSYLASSGKIVLLLDGFDELEASISKETTLSIESLSIQYPELQIIVSSRPNNEIQKLSTFDVLNIAPLQPTDYLPFLEKLGVATTKAAEIVHAINASPSKVSELITTPLMLTLVVFVYQSEKQIPVELPEFFEKLFYTVFTRHDKLKAVFERQHYSGLSERKLQILFEAFCFMSMQLGNSRTLKPEQFTEAFELAQDYVEGSKCAEADFRKDIIKVACLMLEEGFHEATFLHKSIAEYHASAFIKSSDDNFATRFYAEAASNWQHWQECLNFLKSIDPYRFSKYFAIVNISKSIHVFERLASCKTGAEVAAALPDWIKNLKLTYRIKDKNEKNYTFASFGSWYLSPNIYEKELGNALSNVALKTPPNSLSEHALAELRRQGMQINSSADDEIEISLASIIDYWGISDYNIEIANLLSNLKSQLSDSQLHAEKLEKRPLIFDRKR